MNHSAQVVAVGGASGFVGSMLVPALEQAGHTVRRLVRRPVRDPQSEIYWQPAEGEIDAAALEGVDAVVNLGGENLMASRWTPAFKQKIRDSRVRTTELLARTLAGLEKKPRVLCSASAIGFYGVRGDEELDEQSPAGTGFLANTCVEWEAANRFAWEAGIRVCQMRIGVVLSPQGGALKRMLPPFRMGMGGVLGSGRQYMSWIALQDLVAALQFALDHDALHGAVNATAPHPVTNREFTHTLGAQLRRPTMMPLPSLAVRMLFGRELAEEILLGGAKIVPRQLLQEGFVFRTPTLEQALEGLL